MTDLTGGRRAADWPGPHHETFRAVLRNLSRRIPTHRKGS